MIYLYSALFGYVSTIVFQLTERIAIKYLSGSAVMVLRRNVLGFSYLAIPTRHEVTCKPSV